jgi:hypothetical protein
MSIFRHNGTGKYFIILQSQLEGFPTEPDGFDDIIVPYKREVSENVGIKSQEANDFFPITKTYYETDSGGAEVPLTVVPDFQSTLLKKINSEEAKTSLETTSNSNMLGFRIKKGKLKINPSDPEWPTLLNQLSENPSTALLNQSVSRLIQENNLNSPENPFFDKNSFDENKTVLGTIQYKNLGEHGPRKFPNVVQSSPTADQITIEQMKQVGQNLLIAASGTPLQTSDPALEVLNETLQVQSLVDAGDKVNFASFKPSTILSTINPEYNNIDNNDSVFDNSFLVESYGSPNNPSKPYSGTKAQILSPVLLVRIIALSVAFKGIITAYSLYGRALGDHLPNGSSRDRQKLLGSSTANAGAELEALGLDPFETPPLQNDFFLSVEAGFKKFFGVSENFEFAAIGQHAGQNSKEFGYISTFVRLLNRAVKQLASPSFMLGEFLNNPTNSPADVEIDKLKSNFAIKFIKVLSIIGDKVLTVRYAQQQVQVQGIEGYVSDIDGTLEEISPRDARIDPGITIVKSRLDKLNGTTAYANTTLQSLLLVPKGITDADIALSGDSAAPLSLARYKLETTNKVITEPTNDRISQEEVKRMEDYLEMDYMPFYFHDLRTNEIISFHAFLENVSDSLDAEYNETEGYGRTGVVPIYKNTKRNINFSFKILATNENDHEQMWYKVNRLAACLYPQYSEGRLLNYQGNKFIQPFSQVFAASPLMRIRFGDLWKSNYSKLGVARLFGLAGLNDGNRTTFELASTRQISVRASNQTIRERQQQRNASTQAPRALQVGDQVEIRATANKNRWAMASRDGDIMGNRQERTNAQRRGQRIGSYLIAPNLFLYIPTGYVIGNIVEIHPSSRRTGFNYFVKITNAHTGPSGQLAGFVTAGGNIRPRNVNGVIEYGDDPTNWIVCVNPGALNRIVPPPEPVDPEQIVQTEQVNNSIPDFFRCDGIDPNPIMKAFCSTEGKGLACVIKNMSLENIMEAPWSVERFDGRAPQLLTVNMQITPIHDLNPGLDSKGFMTAPVWPAGTIMNNVMGNAVSSREGRDNFIRSRGKYIFPSSNKLRT